MLPTAPLRRAAGIVYTLIDQLLHHSFVAVARHKVLMPCSVTADGLVSATAKTDNSGSGQPEYKSHSLVTRL